MMLPKLLRGNMPIDLMHQRNKHAAIFRIVCFVVVLYISMASLSRCNELKWFYFL